MLATPACTSMSVQRQWFLHLSCGCNRAGKMMLHPTAEAPNTDCKKTHRHKKTRSETRACTLPKKNQKILGCRICLGGCECRCGYRFVCVCGVVYWCVRVSVLCIFVSLVVRTSMVMAANMPMCIKLRDTTYTCPKCPFLFVHANVPKKKGL